VPKEITLIDTDLSTNELKKRAEKKAKRETRDASPLEKSSSPLIA